MSSIAPPRATPIRSGAPSSLSSSASSSSKHALDRRSSQEKLVLTNRAGESRSPYVRGHAKNPVHWQCWTPETLALAAKHNKVLFVSLGYSACHWCHVMERESFENEEVARVINENFVPVKVDREERPDLDRIYMNFVQATTGSGGWPLNVFLTPNLEPVFGGTYWPGPAVPLLEDQLSFLEVLQRLITAWRTQRSRFLESAKEIFPRLKEFTDEGLKNCADDPEESLELDLLEEAYQRFVNTYDPVYGGFALPPKFPVPVKLGLLLHLGGLPRTVTDVVGERECAHARDMAVYTLRKMSRGGIHDQIGHGFHRYSVTADWSLPHFEKMLYDNAQLLYVYTDAWLATGDEELLGTAISTADYLCDDALKNPEGGFFSSEGADSLYRKTDTERREGAFYVWRRKELDTILGEPEAAIAAAFWDVRRGGNVNPEDDNHDEFIHQNVLSAVGTTEKIAQTHGVTVEKVLSTIKTAREKLLAHRNKERARPNLDDKIITSWNGLAIAALSRTSAALTESHPELSAKYKHNAVQAADFVKRELYNETTGELKRLYREGAGDTPGFADDFAFLIYGLLELYTATFSARYLRWAYQLQNKMISLFWDVTAGGFFSTDVNAKDLILRLKEGLDSQEPSTNGIAASNLFRLSAILGEEEFAAKARRTCSAFSAEILEHPGSFSSMMVPVVASNLGMQTVVIVGAMEEKEVQEQVRSVRSKLMASTTMVVLDTTGKGEDVEWLLEKNPVLRAGVEHGKGVQICKGGSCMEAFDMKDLEKALEDAA